ncbi:MAG: hypothetical protein WBM48_17905 [Polyangiales bacterium]
MWYVVGFVLVLPVMASPLSASAQAGEDAVPKAALAIHMQHRLPPHLMLRASYFLYLDTDPINGVASEQTESNAGEPKSVQADGEVATPESNVEESVSSPAPGTAVPDIDTLSQRAMENYEIQSAQRHTQGGRQGGTGERSRGAKAGIAIGVIVGVGLVVFGIAAAVAVSNSFDDF